MGENYAPAVAAVETTRGSSLPPAIAAGSIPAALLAGMRAPGRHAARLTAAPGQVGCAALSSQWGSPAAPLTGPIRQG